MVRARLNGGDGKTQKAGGLRASEASQLAVQHDNLQLLSKPSNCLKQDRVTFTFAKDFFWSRSAVNNLHSGVTWCSIRGTSVRQIWHTALAQ
ncbi:MAG TPA: hypothetical protein VMH20_13895 [Verrucomicrobiae bacterium]|nr:hypothetical protein [Verrucomicrobiae bacterium]